MFHLARKAKLNKTTSFSIHKQMQMETNDTLTIRLQSPHAFVLANGDTAKATTSSEAHLPGRIYVDSSKAENKP
jgi:hypothetical protein